MCVCVSSHTFLLGLFADRDLSFETAAIIVQTRAPHTHTLPPVVHVASCLKLHTHTAEVCVQKHHTRCGSKACNRIVSIRFLTSVFLVVVVDCRLTGSWKVTRDASSLSFFH